jgi:hypothetical protein
MATKRRVTSERSSAERVHLGDPGGKMDDSTAEQGMDDLMFSQDIRRYLNGLPGWREHQGEHVLIYRSEVHGFFPTRSDALREGFRRFGRVAFLVKQIDVDETPRPLVEVII